MTQQLPEPPIITHQPAPFRFSGQAGEFFRIWIVNVCLTILTLGIYSAWAKVRTNQYFYGHTQLAGSHFEYTARPLQILKGRLLAVALFVAYQLLVSLFPLLTLPLLLLVAVALPWVIQRSLMFGDYNTRYRNIRFAFSGGYGQGFMAYIVWPLLSVPTGGLLYPVAACRQQQWRLNNTAFGQTPLKVQLRVRDFYAIYAVAAVLLICSFVLFWLISLAAPFLMPFVTLLALPLYYLAFVYIKVRVTNLTLNNAELGPHRFRSQLRTLPYLAILATNTLAILLTLGLATPWAMIRTARYRADNTEALVAGDLDQFVQAEQNSLNAIGEELGEVLDLELGI